MTTDPQPIADQTAGIFRKYDHLERLAHPDVADISFGVVHIYPKVDGTNASVWCDEDGTVQCGSRTRTLSESADNAGFFKWVNGDDERAIALRTFVRTFQHMTVYGEWLVQHSLKTYRDDAWRRFYVFDVYSHITHKYMPFNVYAEPMAKMGIDVIQPLAIIENPSDNQLAGLRDTTNTYLIQDDAGVGEGIVLKNYDWSNKWGRQPWGKMVLNEFKEANRRAFGMKTTQGEKMVEREIVAEFCTPAFIKKEWGKVVTLVANDIGVTLYEGIEQPDEDGPCFMPRDPFIEANRHKILPRFLGTTYLTFIQEETRTFIKKFRNPVIDFSKLQKLIIIECRRTMRDFF